MPERFKVAYIGAGSFRFSLGLFCNLVNATELLPMEIALCDIDANSLELMATILRRMVKKAARKKGYSENDLLVTTSVDRKVSLTNADMVFKSISVGMQVSEWIDIYLPLKFGIPQNTGDTVGPGGLFRGLRTDPACAGIAADMKKLCPNAPLLNYTNPNSSCTLAGRRAAPDIQFIGLCHELFGGMGTLRRFYNSWLHKQIPRWQTMDIEYAGVNHFAWLTHLAYQGEDLYPVLREKAHHLVLKRFHSMDAANGFNFYLLEKTGYFPYPGARHVAEFLPTYFNYFNHQKATQCPYWQFPVIRSVNRVNNERHGMYFMFHQMAKGRLPVPGPRKAGELAVEMTLDWRRNIPTEYVVNIPNKGIVPTLPEDAIVEVPGQWVNGQMKPKKTIQIEPIIADMLRPHCDQQRLTVDAALGNSYDLVLKAMLHDPMCAWIEDDDKIEALTKLMLFYQQEWLPVAWKEWIPRKEDLESSRYWVMFTEMRKEDKSYLQVKFPLRPELRQKAFFWQV